MSNIQYTVLSPDGFDIRFDSVWDSKEDAQKAKNITQEWNKKSYHHNYHEIISLSYFSRHHKIAVEELQSFVALHSRFYTYD